ncbi:MAG: transposase [Methylococcaceae bacterium]
MNQPPEPSRPPVAPIRRKHSPELKARIVAACRIPGASIARVAADHGLHDSIVRRWLRASNTATQPVAPDRATVCDSIGLVAHPAFVPVRLESNAPGAHEASSTIHLHLQRRDLSVHIDWPAASAAACADTLKALLR